MLILALFSIQSSLRSLSLNSVLHVPHLRASLLSVQKFASDNDVFFEFHPHFFVVKDRRTNKILLSGPSKGGMYSLPVSSPVAFFLIVQLVGPLVR